MRAYRQGVAFIGLLWLLSGCSRGGQAAEPMAAAKAEAIVTPTATPFPIGYPYIANVTDGITYTFTGQVKRGQLFEQELGTTLLFCLLPSSFSEPGGGAWQISVTTKSEEGCNRMGSDYVGLVSPPFHGPNWTLIEGWHFRNAENTGPNDGSVNAPQENRWFKFVLNEADYQTVWAAHRCLRWNDCGEIERDEAEGMIAGTLISSGQLVITDLELGNLEPGQQAWIEQMSFEVELLLPE